MIDINKTYRTKEGHSTRILCVDAEGNYPVVALIKTSSGEQPMSFTEDGKAELYDTNPFLIEVNPFEDYKVDEPVMVRANESTSWRKRHFAIYHNGDAYCWEEGCTSWTTSGTVNWKYCRKPTKEELS